MKKFILIFGLFFGFDNFYCTASKDKKIKESEQTASKSSDEENEEDEAENDVFKKMKVFTKEDCENVKKEIKDKIKKNGKIICYYYSENIMNKKIMKKMQSLGKKFQNKNLKYFTKLQAISQGLDKEDMSIIQKFEGLRENIKNKAQLLNKPYAEEILKISKKVATAVCNDNPKVIEIRMIPGNSESPSYFNPESSVDVSALYHVAILDEIDLSDEKFNKVPKLDMDDLEAFED